MPKNVKPVVSYWTKKGQFTGDYITVVEVEGERQLLTGDVSNKDINKTVESMLETHIQRTILTA